MQQLQNELDKRNYRKPELIVYGGIMDLTLENNDTNTPVDNAASPVARYTGGGT
jgi:hypothetical protein